MGLTPSHSTTLNPLFCSRREQKMLLLLLLTCGVIDPTLLQQKRAEFAPTAPTPAYLRCHWPHFSAAEDALNAPAPATVPAPAPATVPAPAPPSVPAPAPAFCSRREQKTFSLLLLICGVVDPTFMQQKRAEDALTAPAHAHAHLRCRWPHSSAAEESRRCSYCSCSCSPAVSLTPLFCSRREQKMLLLLLLLLTCGVIDPTFLQQKKLLMLLLLLLLTCSAVDPTLALLLIRLLLLRLRRMSPFLLSVEDLFRFGCCFAPALDITHFINKGKWHNERCVTPWVDSRTYRELSRT